MHGNIRKIMNLIYTANIFTWTHGIVCIPEICERACDSSPTVETCIKQNKEFRPNTTFCGCCATCVDYIPVGSACGTKPVMLPFLGIPPPIEKHCAKGTSCIENVCVSIAKKKK